MSIMSNKIVILNKKYNIFETPYKINCEHSHKFFKDAFFEIVNEREKSLENAEILLSIFQNNMFMLNLNEKINYTMHYIVYLSKIGNFRFKPMFRQIVMNLDYHLSSCVPQERVNEWNVWNTFKLNFV